MLKNSEIRKEALGYLRVNWKTPVLTTLVFMAVGSTMAVVPIVGLFLLLPLEFGFIIAFLNLVRGDGENMIGDQFVAFKDGNYKRALSATLLVFIYTFLWSFLLIIPGIIKAYSYAMTYFIANDNPDLTAEECIKKSMEMMDGKKGQLFLLDLSFIGWALLSSFFTLGIGNLWLVPYIYASRAKFYEELKAEKGA